MSALINSYDGWTRLREVWLGDVYPANFYDHLAPEVRDVFCQITEWTQEDLKRIQAKIESFGVKVQRPIYHSVDNHLDHRGQLIKPEITPRDYFVTVGNRLIYGRWKEQGPPGWISPWAHAIEEYRGDPNSRPSPYYQQSLTMNGANLVRVGKDLFLDVFHQNMPYEQAKQKFEEIILPMFEEYDCHLVVNGGHLDACFSILKPGVILCNDYYNDYEKNFPGWELVKRSSPEFQAHQPSQKFRKFWSSGGRWWLPGGVGNRTFNDHIIEFAADWIGDYQETFFEVNCLVIDESNVIVLGENEKLFRRLEDLGITAHPVDFKCRTFWDGGLHCLTVDIRRDGGLVKYL